MSTEEKIKKTKLDEQEENKNLGDGRYSLIIEEKTPSPSVEARLPCPSNFRDHSKSPSEDERFNFFRYYGCFLNKNEFYLVYLVI